MLHHAPCEDSQSVIAWTLCAVMMVARRRLTWMRSVYLVGILVLVIILILISTRYPLDTITAHHPSVMGGILYGIENKPPSEPGKDHTHPNKTMSITPCPLYHLQREGWRGEGRARGKGEGGATQCQRVPPVPGSCDVAKRLFQSAPPANCDGQDSVDICSITATSSGHRAACSDQHCGLTLSGATINVHTGTLLWRKFTSPQLLEKWINGFLLTPGGNKHFGFCYVGCGGDWEDFDGHVYDVREDDDMSLLESMQLLLLPPAVPLGPSPGSPSRGPGVDINFNVIFIDSVSRQHFFRSLPRTVKLLEELSTTPAAPGLTVLDFELLQSVRSRTFETLQVLFSGEIDPSVPPFGVMDIPPEALKTERLLQGLRGRGYSTLWLEDLCHRWEWGLAKDLRVLNRTLTATQTWVKLQQALDRAGIDSLDVTYAMCRVLRENGVPDHFHGPDTVCLNGRHQHHYLLEYLWLYQQAMARAHRPFFTFTETNVGHEDTGRRVQTLDDSLQRYLRHAATLDNTLTIVMSDHGNSYGDFLGETLEGRMELFHPHLFMLVPETVATSLGGAALEALTVNQHRLISHLDLHYTLHSLAQKERSEVSPRRFNTTSHGLLSVVSLNRSCNDIPRIMPNLCLCQNFDMAVESDEYHVLFAHMALGRINNIIQDRYHSQVTGSGAEVARGFGHCQRLRLSAANNIKKSFHHDTVSLKMDLWVPLGDDAPDGDHDYLDLHPSHDNQEIFFVAMQLRLGGGGNANSGSSSIFLQTVDRLTPYSKFSVCADKAVKLQLCVCDVTDKGDRRLGPSLPTVEDFNEVLLLLTPEVFMSQGSGECLVMVVRKNAAGGLFFVANTCRGKAFHVSFVLETSGMVVSDAMPREAEVFPGQEVFLCMAVKSAPRVKWDWSFTLHHRQRDL